jgi:DNA-directed RNA polymerase subunit RPC12/RpoP
MPKARQWVTEETTVERYYEEVECECRAWDSVYACHCCTASFGVTFGFNSDRLKAINCPVCGSSSVYEDR